MKKFLLFITAITVALAAWADMAQFSRPADNPIIFCQMYSGGHPFIKAMTMTLHPNTVNEGRYVFADKDIPALTIGSETYSGKVNETRDTLYWEVNLQAPEIGLTEEIKDNLLTLRIVYTDIFMLDQNDQSTHKIADLISETATITQTIHLNKYQYLDGSNKNDKYALSYPTQCEPNRQYSMLAGDFGVYLGYQTEGVSAYSYTNEEYFRAPKHEVKADIYKADGTLVASYPINNTSYGYYSFHLENPITEPGDYYIVYDIHGRVIAHEGANNLSGVKVSPLRTGPYTVTESSYLPTVRARMTGRITPSELYTDALPENYIVTILNSSALYLKEGVSEVTLACTLPDESKVDFTGDVKCGGDSIVINLENMKAAVAPGGAAVQPGVYNVRVEELDRYFGGANEVGHLIDFRYNAFNRNFTLKEAQPSENVGLFVKSPTQNIEIGENEKIEVRLAVDDDNSQQIYCKWTPKSSTAVNTLADVDENGFSVHDSSIEISEPGVLQYYTRHSNTASSVKSIEFTEKLTAGIDTPEVINLIPGEEGLYDLKGIKVQDTPQTGIYIRRNADGSTRKVIVR